MEIYSFSPDSKVSRGGQIHIAKKEFEMMKSTKMYDIRHSDSDRRNKKDYKAHYKK
jgi:hypothetical protein